MSKIPEIKYQYERALDAHRVDASDDARMMFCAGVAVGLGLGNTIRNDINQLHVDKVEELNHTVVDAMEFSGGAPDKVGILRERVRQDAEEFRRSQRASFEA